MIATPSGTFTLEFAVSEKFKNLLQRDKQENEHLRAVKELEHWSETSHRYIDIADMPIQYIINVLRKMLKAQTSADLMNDDEFKSLILNLADKFSAEIAQEYFAEQVSFTENVGSIKYPIGFTKYR